MKRIRKNYSGTVPNGKVLNTKNNSLEDTYSCNYLNDNMLVANNMGNITVDDIKCKNLLPNYAQSITTNGVTITVNKDKSITFNGTANSTFSYYIFNNYHFKLKAGTYNLSFHKKGTINGTSLVSFYNQENAASFISNINLSSYNNVVSNTTEELDLKNLVVYIVTGCVFNNFTIYPQLEEGSETSDYVPNKEFSNKQVYSTNEQVIGTWVDGRPLYRRVVYIPSLPKTGTVEYGHNIDNIRDIVRFYGRYSNNGLNFLDLNWNNNDNFITTNCTRTAVVINVSVDRTAYHAYITLEYTKTTD